MAHYIKMLFGFGKFCYLANDYDIGKTIIYGNIVEFYIQHLE